MINRTDRPDNVNTDHASVAAAGKDDEAVNGDESATPVDRTTGQGCVVADAVDRQDVAIQQCRAERFPAGRVL